MKIPISELANAERTCTILAELEEDYQRIIEELERHYDVLLPAQVFRPVIGGGAGRKQVVLAEMDNTPSQIR